MGNTVRTIAHVGWVRSSKHEFSMKHGGMEGHLGGIQITMHRHPFDSDAQGHGLPQFLLYSPLVFVYLRRPRVDERLAILVALRKSAKLFLEVVGFSAHRQPP